MFLYILLVPRLPQHIEIYLREGQSTGIWQLRSCKRGQDLEDIPCTPSLRSFHINRCPRIPLVVPPLEVTADGLTTVSGAATSQTRSPTGAKAESLRVPNSSSPAGGKPNRGISPSAPSHICLLLVGLVHPGLSTGLPSSYLRNATTWNANLYTSFRQIWVWSRQDSFVDQFIFVSTIITFHVISMTPVVVVSLTIVRLCSHFPLRTSPL